MSRGELVAFVALLWMTGVRDGIGDVFSSGDELREGFSRATLPDRVRRYAIRHA